MLLTLDRFKSPISSLFLCAGESCWLSGELSMQQAWFLVQLQDLDAQEVACERTVLLFDFRNIEELLETRQQSTLRVKAVHVVTPSHMNGSYSWRMERIKKVVSGHRLVDGKECPIEVLVTTGRKRYQSIGNLVFKGKLIGATLKFDLSA